jgi:hypothetical protein
VTSFASPGFFPFLSGLGTSKEKLGAHGVAEDSKVQETTAIIKDTLKFCFIPGRI